MTERRRTLKRCGGGLVALVAVGVCGCGGAFDSTLQGTVSLNGERLERGKLMFMPTDSEGTTAYAGIDGSGKYRAQTGREFGLKPGDYRVTVSAREKPVEQYGKGGGPPPPGELITPAWYGSPTTSGLKVTVQSGSNDHDFELTTDPPPGWEDASKTARRRR